MINKRIIVFWTLLGILIALESKAQSPCNDTAWLKVTIVQHAIADFKTTITNAQVRCDNTSSNGEQTRWDFGDGTTSNQLSPTHTFAVSGRYTIKLTTVNSCDTNSISKTVVVIVPCAPPSTPSVSLIKSGSVWVSWRSVSGVHSYILEYKKATDPTWTSQMVTDTSVYLTNLKANTVYNVRVSVLCMATNLNLTSGATNFKTIRAQDDTTPDMITPNGDGKNDTFVIPELADDPSLYPNNDMTIINRWGGIVYHAQPYKNEWDGRNRSGDDLPAGTYYYIMRLDIANGEIRTGDVLIMR